MQYNELIGVFIKGFVNTSGGLLALGIGFQLYTIWTQEKKIYKNQDHDEKKRTLESMLEIVVKNEEHHDFEIEHGIKEDSDKFKNLF